MPLVPGCTQTSLFRSFQQYLIHRLRIPQLGPLKSNQIRITLLNRTTQYRQILNVDEIVQHLKNISTNSNNDYLINVVDYNVNIPFIQQLNITHNTDIFMGRIDSKNFEFLKLIILSRNAWGRFNSFTFLT
jgi:protein O-GlcNAc transferase